MSRKYYLGVLDSCIEVCSNCSETFMSAIFDSLPHIAGLILQEELRLYQKLFTVNLWLCSKDVIAQRRNILSGQPKQIVVHGGSNQDLYKTAQLYQGKDKDTYLFDEDDCIVEKRNDLHYLDCYFANLKSWIPRYILKSIIMEYFFSQGYVEMHCSAIDYGGKAVLFIGSKGSGKTTALLSFLAYNHSAKIISNDRSLLKYNPEAECIDVISVDSTIRIGTGTYKAIFDSYKDNAFLDCLRQAKKVGNKLNVSFEELSDFVCIEPVKVSAIVACSLDLNCCSEIENNDHAVGLYDYLFEDDNEHPNWLHIFSRRNGLAENEIMNSRIQYFTAKIGFDIREFAVKFYECMGGGI